MYEAHLRSLLSPLGIYDLEEHSASGAAVCALGTGLDTVSRRLEEIERELGLSLEELQKAVVDGDADGAMMLCTQIENTLAERNRLCKLGKS